MKIIQLISAQMALILICFLQLPSLALAGDAQTEQRLAEYLSNSHCAFAGDFVQSKHLTGLTASLDSAGVFYYHCDHGVIWKTVSPKQSALVFSKKRAAHRVENDEVGKLGARQGRVLGGLLNDLIGGDIQALAKQFEIADGPNDVNQPPSFSLRPRKKSLKRAFKQINLQFRSASLGITEESNRAVSITILDRHDQTTEINPTQKLSFASSGNALQACQQQPSMTELECALLLPLSN